AVVTSGDSKPVSITVRGASQIPRIRADGAGQRRNRGPGLPTIGARVQGEVGNSHPGAIRGGGPVDSERGTGEHSAIRRRDVDVRMVSVQGGGGRAQEPP